MLLRAKGERFVKRIQLSNRKLSKQLGKQFIGINKIGKAHSIDDSDSTLKGAQNFICIVVSTFSERAYNEVDNMQKKTSKRIFALLIVILFHFPVYFFCFVSS